MRRIDQTYTMIDVAVDGFDEDLISKIKDLHPAISLARISVTKFNKDSDNLLKFYVYHWLHTNYDSVIDDINNHFNKYNINTKVVTHK